MTNTEKEWRKLVYAGLARSKASVKPSGDPVMDHYEGCRAAVRYVSQLLIAARGSGASNEQIRFLEQTLDRVGNTGD